MSFQEQSWHGSERMEISISPLSFSLSLLHSPPFLSILSPKRLKRRASCTLFPTLIWVQQKKRERESERGGVYTLLGVYYKAAITFRLFSPFPFHSHTLLTGSGRLPWWLDSITCDSFDLMSLSGSLYLFEQLRGNCVTLAVEDVLWRRTRWTEGTSRGSVAIINEGYFPQNAKTLCMCVSVCVSVCSWWGGTRQGDEPLYPGGIQLWDAHWGRLHPLWSSLSLVWTELFLCMFSFSFKDEFGCHSEELPSSRNK